MNNKKQIKNKIFFAYIIITKQNKFELYSCELIYISLIIDIYIHIFKLINAMSDLILVYFIF